MKERLARFMYGRYGQDDLNRFSSILVLVLFVLSILTQWTILYSLALGIAIYSVFRTFSRNLDKRKQENFAYLRIKDKVIGFFGRIKNRYHDRKTHRYYQCPSCKQKIRVPKGKGRIRIHCPKCQTSFERKLKRKVPTCQRKLFLIFLKTKEKNYWTPFMRSFPVCLLARFL